MDRYVIREARVGANYPQGNQMMAFSTNAGRNIVPTENVYYGGPHPNQYANMQHVPNSNFIDIGNMNTSMFGQNIIPARGQMMPGIDPRYLANYSDSNAQYIVSGQPLRSESGHGLIDTSSRPNYKNLGFGDDKNKPNTFSPQLISNGNTDIRPPMQSEPGHVSNDPSFGFNYENRSFTGAEKNKMKTFTPQVIRNVPRPETPKNMATFDDKRSAAFQSKQNMAREPLQQMPTNVTASKVTGTNASKNVHQVQSMSRTDRLQALHKSGPRAFSGPVEKVLKWHKALQDIGVFVFYEIVAKCVSVRPGESCSKNLVIRDDNGPAMQVVYYEIDFLLPELKVPSTVRVIGRMMAGTCRLQAFNVRPATGDDVATLPRRAAVAAHHVARLCKEYGINV